jgi:alkylation response protein AidB-like acyl-CoA dehydrogenase
MEAALPGLDKRLAAADLAELERPGGPALGLFKEAGGPGLLISSAHGGRGAGLVTAARVQRAIGARSPSLAVASTMHHFSVASLVEVADGGTGTEWMLVAAIARDNLLVASGFAEGRNAQSILRPTLRAEERAGGFVLTGSKKPCSLSRSMDLLTASVIVPAGDDGPARLAVALVPAGTPGISVRPFWNTPALAGAESDEVVLDDVVVSADLVVRTEVTEDHGLDRLQQVGFLWFELLMAAGYLGVASGLVERLLAAPKADAAAQADAVTTLDAAMLAVEAVAAAPDTGEDRLADALICRYSAQRAVTRAADIAAEALGGMAFVTAPDVAYLLGACRALAFHPPNRSRMAEPLRDYLRGEPLRVP